MMMEKLEDGGQILDAVILFSGISMDTMGDLDTTEISKLTSDYRQLQQQDSPDDGGGPAYPEYSSMAATVPAHPPARRCPAWLVVVCLFYVVPSP